jgi:hypothetical protein
LGQGRSGMGQKDQSLMVREISDETADKFITGNRFYDKSR